MQIIVDHALVESDYNLKKIRIKENSKRGSGKKLLTGLKLKFLMTPVYPHTY